MSKEDILEAIANMSVMEVVELISAMEEKFGVTAAAAVAVAAPAGGDGEHRVQGAALWRGHQLSQFDLIPIATKPYNRLSELLVCISGVNRRQVDFDTLHGCLIKGQ